MGTFNAQVVPSKRLAAWLNILSNLQMCFRDAPRSKGDQVPACVRGHLSLAEMEQGQACASKQLRPEALETLLCSRAKAAGAHLQGTAGTALDSAAGKVGSLMSPNVDAGPCVHCVGPE